MIERRLIVAILVLLATTFGGISCVATATSVSPSSSLPSTANVVIRTNHHQINNNNNAANHVNVRSREDCGEGDPCSDEEGFLSIKTLHLQLDDDRNGQVDVEESDEFLREELQYENGQERQKAFHNNKKPITVHELWEAWKKSDVRNWTIDETVEWLSLNVELPEYERAFRDNAVTGASLPKLATDMHYISNDLGIKNPIDRRKISLKATDVVLFGAGNQNRGYLKDGLLALSVCVACIVCWLAYIQHRCSKRELNQMMKDMEGLQRAEESLHALQQELEVARQMQESVSSERDALEKKLKRDGSDGITEHRDGSDEDVLKVLRLEEELSLITDELQRARRQLESKQWLPPPALQLWLQLTYELESHYFNMKKAAADAQLKIAKEGCEKLRKKRSTVLGSFRIAHGGSIDDIDEKILLAKASLTELTQSLKERLYRWNQIEMMCGFNILKNPGLATLQTVLPMQDGAPHLHHNGNLETIDDEMDGGLGSHISAVQQLVHASAQMFFAPVPQQQTKSTYNPLNTWHAGDYAHQLIQPSPPTARKYGHRQAPIVQHQNSSHSLFENCSHASIQKKTVAGFASAAQLIGNPMLSDAKRSRSAGLEHLEGLVRPISKTSTVTATATILKQSCSENSLSSKVSSCTPFSTENYAGHEGSTQYTAGVISSGGYNKATFTVGGGVNVASDSSPDEVEEKVQQINSKSKSSAWCRVKSYSQEQAVTPPREVGNGVHSQSDPTLDGSRPPSPILSSDPSPPAQQPQPPTTISTKLNMRASGGTHSSDQPFRSHSIVFSAAKRLGLRGTPSPVDEEKSSDSSSTIDDDVKKEKKKKIFLKFGQKFRRL